MLQRNDPHLIKGLFKLHQKSHNLQAIPSSLLSRPGSLAKQPFQSPDKLMVETAGQPAEIVTGDRSDQPKSCPWPYILQRCIIEGTE